MAYMCEHGGSWDCHDCHLKAYADFKPRIYVDDDLRAVHYHREQSLRASRRYTLLTLAGTLFMLWFGLLLNIGNTVLRRVLHLGQ